MHTALATRNRMYTADQTDVAYLFQRYSVGAGEVIVQITSNRGNGHDICIILCTRLCKRLNIQPLFYNWICMMFDLCNSFSLQYFIPSMHMAHRPLRSSFGYRQGISYFHFITSNLSA